MKTPSARAKVVAFTLIELLVVISIIAIVAALLLPAKTGRGPRYTVRCMSNQRQIGIGFAMWKQDHNEQFPWQVSSTNGGTLEYSVRGYAAPSFQVLLEYLKLPAVFICPMDRTKTFATNGTPFNNQNVSYFVAFETGTNLATSILTGDRHLKYFNNPVKPGLFVYTNGLKMDWTYELHEIHSTQLLSCGMLSFVDGHVERVMGNNLDSTFKRENIETNVLAIP